LESCSDCYAAAVDVLSAGSFCGLELQGGLLVNKLIGIPSGFTDYARFCKEGLLALS
jgi:hypothetical protein